MDIDYLVRTGSMPYYEGPGGELPGTDPEWSIISGVGNPHIVPVIPFEPARTRVFILGAE